MPAIQRFQACVILSAMFLCLNAAGMSAAGVKGVWVSTDRSVDCSSVERIARDLVRPGMTDEQKVLGVFNWNRRVIYHGDGPSELALDFHKMVNVLGNGSCLRQTAPMALVLKRLGFESRSWVHDTHHMLEVNYGGAWHCLDPHMNFYVYDRSTPPSIASVAQLQADTTLAFDAVAEGRACPGFLLCGDSPRWFCGSGEWTLDAGWPELKLSEPFGRLSLRRGESILLSWMPGEHYWHGAWQFECGPYHTCGPVDEKDSVNFPLYEPYRATVNGIPCYRHWAGGRMVYRPDLRSDHYQDAVLARDNLTHDPALALMQQRLSAPGSVVFGVECPYVVSAGRIALAASGNRKGLKVELSRDGEKWSRLNLAQSGDSLAAEFSEPVAGSFAGYRVRITLAEGAGLTGLELVTFFELNPGALPYLAPGLNTVRLEGGRFDSPVSLSWRWAEGPDWSQERQAGHTFTEPGEFVVQTTEGGKYPRCQSLTLSVAP
ncbi:hypothetical protein LLH00_03405 [bacterium]|nr:hypothetical protein [bacterium]